MQGTVGTVSLLPSDGDSIQLFQCDPFINWVGGQAPGRSGLLGHGRGILECNTYALAAANVQQAESLTCGIVQRLGVAQIGSPGLQCCTNMV